VFTVAGESMGTVSVRGTFAASGGAKRAKRDDIEWQARDRVRWGGMRSPVLWIGFPRACPDMGNIMENLIK